jgi:hypothetical protein
MTPKSAIFFGVLYLFNYEAARTTIERTQQGQLRYNCEMDKR